METQDSSPQESVVDFFDRYAAALSAVDLDALAGCYAYPSLAVSRMGTQAITDPAQTRAFFAQNSARYLASGITAVRIRNLRGVYDHDGLWIGLADLENLDAEERHVGTELNAYQLIATQGAWAIAVSSPLDAPRPAAQEPAISARG